MGAMTFGEANTFGARVHDLPTVEAILKVFRSHGHTEVDTARSYSNGTSEEYLAKVNWQDMGLQVQTKLFPTARLVGIKLGNDVITHSPEDLRQYLDKSLQALNAKQIDIFYLHGPDREIDYAITMKAVDELYREGKFKRFGISNYFSWEVAEIVTLCRANGWVQPTVYQGVYNAIQRTVEPELFPCLRKFGLSFYEYNPLGGGFFTGRYTSMENDVEAGSRFDSETGQGKFYRMRYWNEPYFKALDMVKAVAEAHNLTLPEIALRWVSHHSEMKRAYGDSVIIGASSLKHIEQNLLDLEKGPLPEEVVKVLDDAWNSVKGGAFHYTGTTEAFRKILTSGAFSNQN